MSDTNNNNAQELSFEERINANFGGANNTTAAAAQERLKEVNKKLPSWNLEPPLDFIK